MSSNEFDLQKPATEIEIAEAVKHASVSSAKVIRRLAFELDRLKEDSRFLALMYEANEKLAWECVDLIDPNERGSNPLLILKRLIPKLVEEQPK